MTSKSIWDDLEIGDRVTFETLANTVVTGTVIRLHNDPCVVSIRQDGMASKKFVRVSNARPTGEGTDRWMAKPPPPKFNKKQIIDLFVERG